MTVAVGTGVAGLIEATLGYAVTSLITGGSHSWDPFAPPATVDQGKQTEALQIMRKTLSRLRGDLETQNWIDIKLTSAHQQATWDAIRGLQTLADDTVPALRAYTRTRADGAFSRAVNRADADISRLHDNLVNRIQAVHTLLDTEITDLAGSTTTREDSLSARIHQLRVDLGSAFNTVLTDANNYADRIKAAVEADINTAQAQDRAYALNQADAARTYAHDQAQNALATAEANTATQIGDLITKENGDLQREIAQAWPEFRANVRALQEQLNTDDPAAAQDLAVVPDLAPASEPEAALVAMTAVTALLRTATRCTVPNCRNLSQLGRDLQALLHLLEGAGWLALLVFLVSDPEGAAHEIIDVLGPIVNGAADGARHLLGV